jgi:hypothetical protein
LETSFRDRENSKAKTEDIDCDVDQLNQNVGSTSRTQKSMAIQKVRISKVLERKKRDLFPESHCMRKKINNNEDKEEAARGSSVYLSDIHENTKSKQYYREEMENRSGSKK